MQCFGDYCVLQQHVKGNDLQGSFVGGFQNYRTGCTRTLYLQPASSAHAPAVSWLEARKAKLRHRRGKIVSQARRSFQEFLINNAADGMDTHVVGTGITATVTIEARHRLATTALQSLPKYIARRKRLRVGVSHDSIVWCGRRLLPVRDLTAQPRFSEAVR